MAWVCGNCRDGKDCQMHFTGRFAPVKVPATVEQWPEYHPQPDSIDYDSEPEHITMFVGDPLNIHFDCPVCGTRSMDATECMYCKILRNS